MKKVQLFIFSLALSFLVVYLTISILAKYELDSQNKTPMTPTISTNQTETRDVKFTSKSNKGYYRFQITYDPSWKLLESYVNEGYQVEISKSGYKLQFNQPKDVDGEVCYLNPPQIDNLLAIVLSENGAKKVISPVGDFYVFHARELDGGTRLFSICGPALNNETNLPNEVTRYGLITLESKSDPDDNLDEIREILSTMTEVK